MRKFWKSTKAVLKKIGFFQGRILLSLFYYIFIVPPGLLVRMFSDPLGVKARPESFWKEWEFTSRTKEEMERQF
jgi:hypothetical protein